MVKLHHWQYDPELFVHRCTESHPFLHSEKENPCNGCGAVVEDRELVKYRELEYPRLTMDLLVAGYFGERSRG